MIRATIRDTKENEIILEVDKTYDFFACNV